MGEGAVSVLTPEVAVQARQETTKIEQAALAIVISNQASYESACQFGVSIQTEIKAREKFFEPSVTSAKAAYDEAKRTRDSVIDPLKSAKEIVKKKAEDWNAEQRRVAREAETARIEAQRKAEQEER